MATASATNKTTEIPIQSLTDCMYFLAGTCHKAENCRYRHCRTAADQLNKCRNWPKTCKNVACRYRHPSMRPKLDKPQTSMSTPTPLLASLASSPVVVPVTSQPPEGFVSFFWDIENVCIPRSQTAFDVVQRLRQRLVIEPKLREIGFTCYGDINIIPKEHQISLSHANVRIAHVPDRKSGAADRQILLDLDRFERAQRPPATIVLISGDIDFVGKLSDLRHQVGFHVIVVHNKPAKKELKATVNAHYPWEMFTGEVVPKDNSPEPEKKNRELPKKTKKDSRSETPTGIKTPKSQAERFRCHECACEFTTENALHQHQQDKNHRFLCTECTEGFFTHVALIQHQQAKGHQEKSITRCNICQQVLETDQVVPHMTKTQHASFSSGPPSLFPPALASIKTRIESATSVGPKLPKKNNPSEHQTWQSSSFGLCGRETGATEASERRRSTF